MPVGFKCFGSPEKPDKEFRSHIFRGFPVPKLVHAHGIDHFMVGFVYLPESIPVTFCHATHTVFEYEFVQSAVLLILSYERIKTIYGKNFLILTTLPMSLCVFQKTNTGKHRSYDIRFPAFFHAKQRSLPFRSRAWKGALWKDRFHLKRYIGQDGRPQPSAMHPRRFPP